MESTSAFMIRMKSIKVPEGFTAEFGEDTFGFGEKVEKYANFTLTKAGDTRIKFDQYGGGHTEFTKEPGMWLCFDRTGVEDSFYHADLYGSKKEKEFDLDAIVTEQLARIAKRREYYKTAVSVPSIPFTVAPDKVPELKKQLAKHSHITFTPSGFGTGYVIAKKPTRGCRYGEKRADANLEAFLGHSPLYVATMDCD